MKSIDRLRECAAGIRGNGNTMQAVADEFECPVPVHSYVLGYVADAIEKEVKERYMPLPTARDGEPIHVGDTVVDYKTPRKVVAIAGDGCIMLGGYPCDGEQMYRMGIAVNFPHYKKPTVEGVLAEMLEELGEPVDLNFVERYAKRLRIAEERTAE